MSLIKKSVPCKEIIEILSKEIKEFGLSFAKDIKPGNVTKSAFDKFISAIPKTTDNVKASRYYGQYSMERRNEPYIKQVIDILGAHSCTNTVYYCPNSCIDWHTNSDNVGTRIYILFTNKPGIFRYKDPMSGKIIDDEDYVGWTQREFKVDKDNLLWHCVYSPSSRFAYGFNKND
jgi:Pyruvate/2-oxoacid:ferredoxin oxidoreductase delta subunit